MKIVVCGPPHSGKSVFIANLEKRLPTNSFKTIRVHRDGEGTWSNNPNLTLYAAKTKTTTDSAMWFRDRQR